MTSPSPRKPLKMDVSAWLGSGGGTSARARWLGLALFTAAARGGDDPSPAFATIQSAPDVVRQWQPHQRLFVKGNVGVARSQLDSLEQWLDAQATNWVVVLLESAAGETYTDGEGARFSGVEAVNHALGKGLMNQTAFGEFRDPRTQEHNAAIFVLALKDRRLSYFGSDAQDRRGLGEERWVGNLDQPAIAAMRNGGRVVDAVKETVATINRRLDQAIKTEIETRERRLAEEQTSRVRAEQQARAEFQAASDALARLTARADELSRRLPEATGELARPERAKLRASLEDAARELTAGNFSGARAAAEQLRAQIETALRAVDTHQDDAARLERAAARHQQLAHEPRAEKVRDRLDLAARALEQAVIEHRRADRRYVGHLGEAEQALSLAAAGIAAAERAAKVRRAAAWAGAGYLVALLTIAGLVLNRRRAKVKREAGELCAAWERALSEKTDALFGLLDRRGMVVGSSATEAARRYAGETLKLAQQIIQAVDELFIMSACASRVLTDAKALLNPRGAGGRVANWFLQRRFTRALRLLRDEPVAFRPDEGLELVVRGARTERDRLLGRREDYEAFRMTFTALIESFNRRAERAVANLGRIETAVGTVAAHFTATETRLPEARAALQELDSAGTDGLLPLTELRDGLLPAAEATLAEARALAAVDPVAAESGWAARAQAQAEDAAAVVAVALRARTELLPRLQESAAALAANGVATPWIGAECARLSAVAEELARAARETSQRERIQDYGAAWDALGHRVAEAVALDERRRGPVAHKVSGAETAVGQGRQELAAGLGLPAEQTLSEADAHPGKLLEKAREQLVSAHAALERGDLSAVASALDAASDLADAVQDILQATRASFAEHAEALRALREESARITDLLPAQRDRLEAMRARFSRDALRLGAGDPTHPNANGTVADNVDEAGNHLARARELAEAADAALRAARLLEAARLRENIAAEHKLAAARLEEIREKEVRLLATERANSEKLAEAESRLRIGERLAATPATMAPTRALLASARDRLNTLRPQVGAAVRDPFATAEALETILRELDVVQDRARCDSDVFEEAERSVRAAAVQLTEAQEAAARAATDNVSDSAAIRSVTTGLPGLSSALVALQTRLAAAHQDWHAVDAEADRIAAEAARATATLRGELARAEAAVREITAAAVAVRKAGSWTGGFGVLILGSPGSDTLDGARAWLQRGDYERARSHAETARRAAEAAIAQAVAEAERRRLAELARIERERRQRAVVAAEMARATRRSTGGFGGLGGGSSWGSSGSGFGSSSFGGGGSGFRTSGW